MEAALVGVEEAEVAGDPGEGAGQFDLGAAEEADGAWLAYVRALVEATCFRTRTEAPRRLIRARIPWRVLFLLAPSGNARLLDAAMTGWPGFC